MLFHLPKLLKPDLFGWIVITPLAFKHHLVATKNLEMGVKCKLYKCHRLHTKHNLSYFFIGERRVLKAIWRPKRYQLNCHHRTKSQLLLQFKNITKSIYILKNLANKRIFLNYNNFFLCQQQIKNYIYFHKPICVKVLYPCRLLLIAFVI